jgi:hypothetical protein
MVNVAHHPEVAILDEFYALETPYMRGREYADAPATTGHPDIVFSQNRCRAAEPSGAACLKAQDARVAHPVSERGKEKQ